MNIDKNSILEMLRGNGKAAEADQAAQELPDQVDTEQHAGLLSKFGINPAELIAKFTGGSGGGLGGMLGGLTGGGAGNGGAGSSGGLGGLLGNH